jgi:hypothetical protein
MGSSRDTEGPRNTRTLVLRAARAAAARGARSIPGGDAGRGPQGARAASFSGAVPREQINRLDFETWKTICELFSGIGRKYLENGSKSLEGLP